MFISHFLFGRRDYFALTNQQWPRYPSHHCFQRTGENTFLVLEIFLVLTQKDDILVLNPAYKAVIWLGQGSQHKI